MAFSGQTLMQALQRVQTSRSIGFSWRHATSNAPSQPRTDSTLPEYTEYARSCGSSLPAARLVISTVTARWVRKRSAHESAAAAGPMINNCPPDLKLTRGTGCGSGSTAAAIRAAILGIALVASLDHPALSRTLTKRIVCALPASSAGMVPLQLQR